MVQTFSEHLLGRGLDLNLYDSYAVDQDSLLTLPLYDFGKRYVGFHQYNRYGDKKLSNKQGGKYWTYKPKETLGLFGIGSMYSHRSLNPVYLVGGLFKASKLHMCGYAALHVSGNNPKQLKQQLDLLGCKYYAFGDNDQEGKDFVDFWGGEQTPQDVDELTNEHIHHLCYESIYKC